MKTLECPESDQYINRAINMSYEKCSDEDQEAFVRLSVFEGSFSEDAAKEVIEKDKLDTSRIVKELVSRSLIKQPTKHRYSIHRLIKHFLKDQQKNGEQKSEKALAAAMRAKVLMVKYYLKLGHQLTMKSYSKDGYKENREAFKRESSNIQNVLKICCQQEEHATSSDISDCLAHSKIYTTSAKFFSLFVRTIVSGSIVDEFLQRCANMAEERKENAIKIDLDCLLADRERTKTIGKPDEYFFTKMEEIKEEFETHRKELKKEKSLCAHFSYHYGRYLSRKSESCKPKGRLKLQTQAREQLEKSLELRETLIETSEGKADKVFSLLHLGNTCKSIGSTERTLNYHDASKTSLKRAEEYYREAIQLSQGELGDHELTSSCCKNLGDLFFTIKEHKLAEKEYTIAKKMRENLGLDASERHVLLLNNLGNCLRETNRAKEAIEVLESARDTAEKLAESDEPTVCKTKVYTSLAIAYDSVRMKSEASVRYAKKAMEFDGIEKIIKPYEYKYLQKILQT